MKPLTAFLAIKSWHPPLYEEDKKRLHEETRILYIARANFDIIKVQYFDDKGNITRVFEGYDFSEEDTALNPDRGVMDDKKRQDHCYCRHQSTQHNSQPT